MNGIGQTMQKVAMGCVIASCGLLGSAYAASEITVVSWGGSYTAAQKQAFYEPFTKTTGVTVRSQDYNGGLGEIRAQEQAGKVVWDVVVSDMYDVKRACDEGLIERIPLASLGAAPDGTPATKDFLAGTTSECGIGSITLGNVIAYNTTKIAKAPTSLKDFFDTKNFPGKRGLRKSPIVALEWALMADGVAPADVYATLSTPVGLDRAFRKLDTIKKDIVWWEAGAQPLQLLASGDVAMTSAYSGRLFVSQMQGSPYKAVWDGQVWSTDVWMIPKGAPHMKEALAYVKFVSEPARLAELATLTSNGVVRHSALPLIGKYPGTDVNVASHTPTYPDNLKTALQINHDFWNDRQDEIQHRFDRWLLQN
ncbi:MAG: ABC transporter substrate-binding protein [Paraburkholderia sp.]|uniref:Putative spermidine/putrescine transport system substrate-binding protein n=1 Tax=Paraburkholderia terricola TaxID=169427 RepID=A0A1M6YZX9_9BURK|nr:MULTISPECIES: ABC transporter substrate-binding protein [Paraburkholderia]TAL95178.1 MAG: ABC transporter substrate-binding protein [Paraburkholderia sp.]SDP43555.1 putative spermidine/putrescine transport system substrate-binding protein [Paraburkholderia sediminicola]SHL23808.1 putative spermidine/putrescine transport system substrate-binding protein [Paraburkholderia terricola]